MGNVKPLSYGAEMVRGHDNDAFLAGLFVSTSAREAVLAAYALNLELLSVHHLVSEEMIGHIRYAWWEESLQMIRDSKPRREHPVITALPASAIDECMRLADYYRSAYPEKPTRPEEILNDIALSIIRSEAPQSEAGWLKAKSIIGKHRKQFGEKANGWLKFKLLAAGSM